MANAPVKKPAKKAPVDPDSLSNLYSVKWRQHPTRTNPELPDTAPAKFKIIPSEVLFGLEFEIENARRVPDYWVNIFTFDEDGSLRDGGRELKYCGKGVALERALYEYHTNLPKEVTFSPRTSIHVHVDCRNLTADRMLQFLTLAILYERVFYAFCGEDRQSSAFCVPIYKTPICAEIRTALDAVAFGGKGFHKLQAVESLRNMWSKYLGVNMAPLSSFGTLEFRQMQGHRDMEKVTNWLNILGLMKLSTNRNTFEDLLIGIKELNTNSAYEIFTRNIFGQAAVPLLDIKNFSRFMEDGVISIKHAFSPIQDILKFMKSVKEDSSYYKTFPDDAIKPKQKENEEDNRLVRAIEANVQELHEQIRVLQREQDSDQIRLEIIAMTLNDPAQQGAHQGELLVEQRQKSRDVEERENIINSKFHRIDGLQHRHIDPAPQFFVDPINMDNNPQPPRPAGFAEPIAAAIQRLNAQLNMNARDVMPADAGDWADVENNYQGEPF